MSDPEANPDANADRGRERDQMVDRQLRSRGISDARVLAAFREVPREAFVEPGLAAHAYDDRPLPIGEGQTISQPFVVALMVEVLSIAPGGRVLEVGAGSGYAAAILGQLATRVVAVERHPALADAARARLARLGYTNIEVHDADGMGGWPEAAPYDAILVSAAASSVPSALVSQLAARGRLAMPVGGPHRQDLLLLAPAPDGRLTERRLGQLSFVPLTPGVARPDA
ncbi:MAG TPA: protein-L-isoaspartate(D-aspartate) O-methyltransferase [Candidatus Limnocylindrales bacterium]